MNRVRQCRVCGCTDANCTDCVSLTGASCWWLEPDDLCSACRGVEREAARLSPEQFSMLKALHASTRAAPFKGNYKRMQGGRGISIFNRTAKSLYRLRLADWRGFDAQFGATGGGGWYITDFGRRTLGLVAS